MRKLNLFSNRAGKNVVLYSALTIAGMFATQSSVLAQCDAAPGTAQGTVYDDSNFNGVQDSGEEGISNVLVNAFAANGELAGQAMTDFFGAFSVDGLSDGQSYRLEFVYGSSYRPSLSGNENGTDIQFLTAPVCDQELALVNPDAICAEGPQLALTCFVRSDELNSNDAVETIVYTDYNFNLGSSVGKFANKQETGSVWGLTWKSSTRKLFSAAFVKQYAALTPHGHDAIFSTDVNTGTTVLHAKLSDLGISTGTVNGNHNDVTYGAQTGKTGLGGLEISDDEQTLYVIDIYNNALVELSSTSPSVSTTKSYSVPDPGCANGDSYRAFAITKHDGNLYVGVTCTSEESGPAGELSVTVFEFSIVDQSFTEIFSTDFPKGYWTDVPANSTATQAWLTDLAFTDEGNMVLSLSDRIAHRFADPVTNGRLDDQHPDILLAYDDNGTWKLESGAQAGSLTGSHPNSSEGPGGGEFFGYDYWISGPVYHSEIATGSVAALPGTGSVVATVFDPDFDSYTGGLHRYSTSNGSKLGAAIVYEHSNDPQFGKASGLGDLVPMCGYIPLEIGNLVWIDEIENGVQDPGEAILANVELSLYDANCNKVGMTTTDENGNYYFNSTNVDLNNDNVYDGLALGATYSVVISDSRFDASTGLLSLVDDYTLTSANIGFGTNTDRNDSDATNENACEAIAGLPSITLTTGGSGDTDHSFDLGFTVAQDLDLALIKEIADDQVIRYGEPITFNITIFNQGGVIAPTVHINDYISSAYTFDADMNDGWEEEEGYVVTSLDEPLLPGGQATISISLILNEGASGAELLNYAEIGGVFDVDGNPIEDIDSTPDNRNDNDNGGVVSSETDNMITDDGTVDEDDHDPAGVELFDLALRKVLTSASSVVLPNSKVEFTITVFNQGSVVAREVTISDYLPSQLSFDGDENAGWSQLDDSTLTYTILDEIAPLGSRSVNLTLGLGSDISTDIINYAEITSASDEDGIAEDVDSDADDIRNNDAGGSVYDLTDNELNDSGQLDEDDHDPALIGVTAFDLALTKKTEATSVTAGTSVEFDVTIINQGDIAADNITIVDYVPDGLNLNDSEWKSYGDNMAKCTLSSSDGSLPEGGLAPGDEFMVKVTMDVADDFLAGTLINFAEIGHAEDTEGNDRSKNDVDSSPDDISDNDTGGSPFGPSDNEIMDNGVNDEDDHDPAFVYVFASQLEDPCICLNNTDVTEVGQFGEIIKVTAVSGLDWYVHQAQGIYDAGIVTMGEPMASDFTQGIAYPLTPFATGPMGYLLQEVPLGITGNSEYFLTGIRLDNEPYEIVLRSSIGDQTILNGEACNYEQSAFDFSPGVCAGSLVTYCVEDFNSGSTSNSWTVVGDASIVGPGDGECVDVQYGATVGDEVMIAFEDFEAIGCYSPARATVTIGESGGSLSCLSNVNASLDQFCDLGLTAESLLTSEINASSVYTTIYQDALGNMLPINPNWQDYIGEEIIVKVMDACSGNSCWSFVQIEDKRAPEIECFDITVSCIEMRDYVGPFTLDNCSGEGNLVQTGETVMPLDCDDTYVSTIVRTYKATDDQGNESDECTQNISVLRPDLEAVVSPPNYTVENSNPLSCAGFVTNEEGDIDPITYGVPTLEGIPLYPQADQFCNLGVAYQDQVLPTNDCVQKIMRTWTVFEWWCTFGEMDTIVQVFNIADMEDPEITCPDDMTVSSNGTTCEGNITLSPAVITDDCTQEPVVDITYPGGFIDNMNGGDISLPIGTHQVTYTVYDDCFNSSDCSIMVTVRDNAAPIAVCHQNTVLGLRSDGTTYAFASAFDDGSYDDCGFDRIEVRRMDAGAACDTVQDTFSDIVEFCCADVGAEVMVILRAYDLEGNINDCMVNVEIQDKNPPTISGPADMTISCLTEINFDDLSEFGSATAMDNCMNATITETHVSTITECRTGEITRTFTASDGNGTASTQQVITIVNEDPFDGMDIEWPEDYETSAECDPGSLSPDNLPAPFNRPTFTEDFCDQVAVSYSDLVYNIVGSNGACQKIVRSWIIEDFCQPLGNNQFRSWEWDQTITISNEVAPVITSDCSDETFCSFDENCSTGMVTLTAGASDDCTPGAMLNWSYAIDFDKDGNLDVADMGSGDSITVIGDYPLGDHSIVFSFEDLCGNSVVCTKEFTIENCLGPVAVCRNLSVGLEPWDTDGDGEPDTEKAEVCAYMFDASSTHACDLDITFSYSEDPTDTCRVFTCDDIGIDSIPIYVIDETGRFDICVATLDVQDNNDVNICDDVDDCVTMPLDTVITTCVDNLLPETIGSMPVVDPDCICTNFDLDFTDTILSDSSNTCTVIQRDWVVTFNCSSTPKEFLTTQMITKFNDAPPILDCPDNVTVASSADACNGPVTVDVPSVLSDCSTGTVITNDSEFATSNTGAASGDYPVGTTSVIYTVTDECGNASTCEVFVTVTDAASPICLTNDVTITVTDELVDVTIDASQVDNGSNDECGSIVSRTVTPNTFGCDRVGVNVQVTLTITDDSGNDASCSARVTVADGVAPVCIPDTITNNIVNPGNINVPALLIDDGSFDPCGGDVDLSSSPSVFTCDDLGMNDVTLTVTDEAGNTSSCIGVITLNDREDPDCVPMDITVQLDGNDMATITAADVDGGSTDGCSGLDTLTVTPSMFTCDNIGTNDVTLSVTDVAGNMTDCIAQVTVEASPELVCSVSDITVFLEASGSVTITAEDVDNGSGIPCAADVTVSIDREEFFCNDVGIPREVEFIVSDGNVSDTCVSMVMVLDTIPPILTCPMDVTVNCQDLNSDLSVYGDLSTAGSNCLVMQDDITETPTFNLDDCGLGTVVRSFLAVDINGNSATCDQMITVVNPDIFDETDITWPVDTFRLEVCLSIDPDSIDSRPTLNVAAESCSNVSLDFEDMNLTNSTNCMDTISRIWTAIDSCQLEQGTTNGIFTFEQIIIVNDEMAPIINAIDTIMQCDSIVEYMFTVDDCNDVTVTNTVGTGTDIGGVYPDGETKVFITATDRCGNEATDSIVVVIELDTVPPAIICVNRTIVIDADGVTEVTAADPEWYFSVTDEGTPVEDLMFDFSTDFTMDTIDFICDSVLIKSHVLSLYVKDKGGNIDSCMASYVTVDTLGICGNPLAMIQGQVMTESKLEVPEVQMNLISGDMYVMTDEAGFYNFPEMEDGSSYELKPEKDTDHMSGVTTLDLVLIQRHILGISPLSSAYQHIAADINKSGTISGKDLLDLKKNILGLRDEFPGNTSWRFVDEDYKFLNESDPLVEQFPESYMIYNLDGAINKNFIGVKIGDVNGSIQMNGHTHVANRSTPMNLEVLDSRLEALASTNLEVKVGEDVMTSAYQLRLKLDKGISVEAITSGARELTLTDYAVVRGVDHDILTMVIIPEEDWRLEAGEVLFEMKLSSQREGFLSDLVEIDSDFDNELYTAALNTRDLELVFERNVESNVTSIDLQNSPNPWSSKTVISFNLDKEQHSSLKVYSADGRLVKNLSGIYNEGLNTIEMTSQDFAEGGVYYFELVTDSERISERMILIK